MSGTRRFERKGQPSAAQSVDWLAIERSSEFQELVHERRRWLTPMTIVFLVGSLGYLLLAAFVPGVMGWQVAATAAANSAVGSNRARGHSSTSATGGSTASAISP